MGTIETSGHRDHKLGLSYTPYCFRKTKRYVYEKDLFSLHETKNYVYLLMLNEAQKKQNLSILLVVIIVLENTSRSCLLCVWICVFKFISISIVLFILEEHGN